MMNIAYFFVNLFHLIKKVPSLLDPLGLFPKRFYPHDDLNWCLLVDVNDINCSFSKKVSNFAIKKLKHKKFCKS